MGYKPRPEAAKALRYVKGKIDALPYEVSLRWATYRILQDLGYGKKIYRIFIGWTRRARKNFWEGWAPDTLVDDTRETHWKGRGYDSFAEWLSSQEYEKPIYDAIKRQGKIVVCAYEARAMHSQFEYYVGRYRISLIPFGGDLTIEPKWRIAKKFEELHKEYNLPITVLYFGDLDTKGKKIPEYAFRDIKEWCSVPFEVRWCGLLPEHVKKYKLRDNPERPGQYQWEALDDPQAAEVILGAIDQVWNRGLIEQIRDEEKRDAERWRGILARVVKRPNKGKEHEGA